MREQVAWSKKLGRERVTQVEVSGWWASEVCRDRLFGSWLSWRVGLVGGVGIVGEGIFCRAFTGVSGVYVFTLYFS